MTPALYPALKSNVCIALRLGHFAEHERPEKSADWVAKALREGWVNCPAFPLPFALPPKISRVKTAPATFAYKGSNTAFHSLKGVRIPSAPQEGHTSPHRVRHGVYGFRLQHPMRAGGHWQRMVRQNLSLGFRFSEPFGRSQAVAEDAF